MKFSKYSYTASASPAFRASIAHNISNKIYSFRFNYIILLNLKQPKIVFLC